ncbi:MAG: TetR/AcrR family transcriptional regulator [Steroidobacteraceae bacterium]|jgi:AcrR family transcriptional regulator
MTSIATQPRGSRVRNHLVEVAYRLFLREGIRRVGIDTILAKSGNAKATLYKHFRSKTDLTIAALDLHETLWTRRRLEAQIDASRQAPIERLTEIFDFFNDWFNGGEFEGCLFISVLLEFPRGGREHRAASAHLGKIREIVCRLARDAGLSRPQQFTQIWHMLMVGSIVSAGEGNRRAAREAKSAGSLVLGAWPRVAASRSRKAASHRQPRLAPKSSTQAIRK